MNDDFGLKRPGELLLRTLSRVIRSVLVAGMFTAASTCHSAQDFGRILNRMQQMLNFFAAMNALSGGARTGLGNWSPTNGSYLSSPGSMFTPNTILPSWAPQTPEANPFPTLKTPPEYGINPYTRRPLDGYWLSSAGAVLVIRRGLARLYASDSVYQDFHIRTRAGHIALRNPLTDQHLDYQYAISGSRLMFRDKHGNLLAFRRITPPS